MLMPAETLTSDIDAFKRAALSCPLPAAVELIGEKWAFLILRGALNGLRHFEEFQAGLGIARNILSDRLSRMGAGESSSERRTLRTVVASFTRSPRRVRTFCRSSLHFGSGARNGAMAP